jgi:ComF family protein
MVESSSLGTVCGACWGKLKPYEGILCSICGYPLPSIQREILITRCGACRRQLYAFDFARTWSLFEDPFKEIIHQFKYNHRRGLAFPLACRLVDLYGSRIVSFNIEGVIPVPLHQKRKSERGFNQSAELARHFCRQTGLPFWETCLKRTRATLVQAGLSRRERRNNVRGAFEVPRGEKVVGKKILLVDDVFTTGVTLNECASVLKKAGASRVAALTLARVVK